MAPLSGEVEQKVMTSRGFGSGNPNYLVMTETCRDKVLAFNFLKFPSLLTTLWSGVK